jgi:hypothetical protein
MGFIISLKLLSISRQPKLNALAKVRVTEVGQKTFINLIFLIGGGLAMVVLTQRLVTSTDHQLAWNGVSLIISITLTYTALALGPVHVGSDAASRMLSLLARSAKAIVPRIDR